MTTMEALKYPVGRFDMAAALPVAERSAFLDSIASTPRRMKDAVAGLTDAQLDTPYRDGGWTVRQVVHHVPDSHMNAYVRMRLGLTEDAPTIRPYNEAAWAKLHDACTSPIALSLDLLEALHARWDVLLRSLKDADYARGIVHPENGRMTLSQVVGLYEWHGRHHVAHINNLRDRMGWR